MLFVLALSLVISGCRRDPPENPYAPNGEYFEKLDAAGQRVIVVGGDGERRFKLRKRLSNYKVYDAEMQPLGRISWEPSSDARKRPRQQELHMRRLGADQNVRIEKRADDVYELPGVARMERTNRGWAIFSSSGDVMGSLERSGDSWELARTYDGEERLRVLERDGDSVLVRGDETQMRVSRGELGRLELLMQGLSELDPLQRALMGAWFESRMSGETGD